jgi:death-on-curing protein
MGETGGTIIFPKRDEVIELNRYHIANTGGFHNGGDNLRSRGSLEWVLDAIQHPLFGIALYPTIIEKAAILSWIISAEHIFHDGNKRTGTSSLLIFLQVNGYHLEVSNDEIIEMIIRISARDYQDYIFQDYVEWIRSKIVLIDK